MECCLKGIRVLDLSQVHAGPFGSMILGDLGAEIIKIEPPEGDPTRRTTKYYINGISAFFIASNRSKKSIVINLKTLKGLDIFYELVKISDVVYDNFRPGVTEKLKINYSTLTKINPKIITCSVSGFGSYGPYRDLPAYDILVQGMGGTMSLTGEPNSPPTKIGVAIGDYLGGIYGTYGVIAALYQREHTGQGQRVEVSMLDAQISLLHYHVNYYLASGIVPKPIGTAHPNIVPYQAFKTRDHYILVAILNQFWKLFCQTLEISDLAIDPRFSTEELRLQNKAELIQILEGIFLTKTAKEWVDLLWAVGLPAGPIKTVDQVVDDECTKVRKMIVELKRGDTSIRVLGNPIKMGGALPEEEWGLPPSLGEHTNSILNNLLGFSIDKIEKLKEEGVIG